MSFRDEYGGFSLAKIRRIAEHWRGREETPPANIEIAISSYEEHADVFGRERAAAWTELLETRLPTPPSGYYWHHATGGIWDGESYFFRLWRPDFGYPPQQE